MSPDGLVVVVEFFLDVVTILVGNALEPGDLYVVRPSRVDPLALPCSDEPECAAGVPFRLDASTAFAEIWPVAPEVVPADRFLPAKRPFLGFLVVLVF